MCVSLHVWTIAVDVIQIYIRRVRRRYPQPAAEGARTDVRTARLAKHQNGERVRRVQPGRARAVRVQRVVRGECAPVVCDASGCGRRRASAKRGSR